MVYFLGRRSQDHGYLGREISLGEFEFIGEDLPGSHIASAKFRIHISLLTEVDRPARMLLAMRRFQVQQDVEELLRQAHAGDFDDPTLTELKRQLQETINRTLGQRVIADVIITDLAFEKIAAAEQPPQPEAAKDPSAGPNWKENAPSEPG